jgi:hypothetical protein
MGYSPSYETPCHFFVPRLWDGGVRLGDEPRLPGGD